MSSKFATITHIIIHTFLINPLNPISDDNPPDSVFFDFLQLFKQLSFIISGTNSYEQAQVTAGGIDLTQVDDTLQSKLVNGLYFAGEILDVDGTYKPEMGSFYQKRMVLFQVGIPILL